MPTNLQVDPDGLNAIFAKWSGDGEPGLVAAVRVADGPEWRRAYGLASVELPVANSLDLRMRIGSTSKWMLSLAAHLTFDGGLLSPTTPLREVFPQFPAWADGITMDHLLRHTSGLRCHVTVQHLTGAFCRPTYGLDFVSFTANQSDVSFRPGEHYAYNNGAYHIVSRALEEVSGAPLAQILEERVFRPLGMADTTLKRSDMDMLPQCASLHVKRPDGTFERGFAGTDILGEGELISTLDDLLRWLENVRTRRIGSPAAWAAINRPTVLNSGAQVRYGAGVVLDTRHGIARRHHAGGVIGGMAHCMTAPNLGLDITMMTNRADVPVMELADQVFDQVLGISASPRQAPVGWRKGAWISDATGVSVDFGEGEGGVQLLRLPVSELAATADELTGVLPAGEISLSASGEILELEWLGRRETLRLLTSSDRAEATALALGFYVCRDAMSRAEIAEDPDGLFLVMTSQYGSDRFRLTYRGSNVWNADSVDMPLPVGGILEVDEGGFRLSNSRLRRLPFMREQPELGG